MAENIYKFKNKLDCELVPMFSFTQSQKIIFCYISKQQKPVKSIRRAVQEQIILKSRLSFLPQGLCRKWGCITQIKQSLSWLYSGTSCCICCLCSNQHCSRQYMQFPEGLKCTVLQLLVHMGPQHRKVPGLGSSTSKRAHFVKTFFFGLF